MADFRERINELYDEARDRNHAIGRKGFAELLGVTRGQANGWIDGTSRPNFETLQYIAAKAGVTSSWLIGESEFRNYPNVHVKGATPETRKDYLLLLDFLKFKYRAELAKKRRIVKSAEDDKDGEFS